MKKVTLSGGATAGLDGNSPPVLFQPSSSTGDPLLSVELSVSHKDTSSALTEPPTALDGSTTPESSFFDHHIKLCLQPTVVSFDRKVAIKLTELFTLLGGSFNTE